jgi:hypothetical protein
VKIHEHAALWTRALSMQAPARLAGAVQLHNLVCAQGFGEGTALGWLDQRGMLWVVPAKAHMAVTAKARAQTAAGEDFTVGRRVASVRYGQGNTAWPERLETEVVGSTSRATYEQYGTPEPWRQHHRRACPPHPLKAVVVRQWQGRDDGPGSKTVLLTHAAVAKALQPLDADAERRLIEHGGMKATKRPWD